MDKLIAKVHFKSIPKRVFNIKPAERHLNMTTYTHTCGPSLKDSMSCAFFKDALCPSVAATMCLRGVYFEEVLK
jgi:hypothetical protein